jgi:hypothetical protein
VCVCARARVCVANGVLQAQHSRRLSLVSSHLLTVHIGKDSQSSKATKASNPVDTLRSASASASALNAAKRPSHLYLISHVCVLNPTPRFRSVPGCIGVAELWPCVPMSSVSVSTVSSVASITRPGLVTST